MGSLPYVSLPRDDQRGGCGPLFGFSPGQSYGLPGDPSKFHLRGRNESALAPRFSPLAKTLERRTPGGQSLRGTSTVEQRGRRLCGGFQRGACAPLCVVADEGVTGEKPHRKGFSLRAVFWLLFVRTKSNPGCGAGSPIRFRKETCFSPPPGDGRISPASAGCAGPAPSKSGCGARRPRGESIYIIMYSAGKRYYSSVTFGGRRAALSHWGRNSRFVAQQHATFVVFPPRVKGR